MIIATIAHATSRPVTVDQLKAHMQIDEADWDAQLEIMLDAAIAFAAQRTGLRLAPMQLQARLDAWPLHRHHVRRGDVAELTRDAAVCLREIEIPDGPVRSVVAVTYVDRAGVEQTVSADQYTWERTDDGALVTFEDTFTLPDLKTGRRGVVRVEFDAGFDDPAATGTGDDPDLKLPDQVRLAVLMLAAHYFENREAVSQRQTFPVLLAAEAMLDQVRVYR